MNLSPYILIQIGPPALLAGLLALVFYYIHYARAPQPKNALGLPGYLLGAVVVGVVAFVIGTMLGIEVACSPADAGNLCGLVGVFGGGPLLAAIALVAFAHFRTRAARKGSSR